MVISNYFIDNTDNIKKWPKFRNYFLDSIKTIKNEPSIQFILILLVYLDHILYPSIENEIEEFRGSKVYNFKYVLYEGLSFIDSIGYRSKLC